MPDSASARAAADLRLELGRLVRRLRAESSLPLGQLAVLGLLDRDGAHSISDLATAQLVRHQSMARTVSLLVGAGAVMQAADPADGRKTQLTITTIGRRLLERERERRVDWLASAIEQELGADEMPALRQATDLLGRLARI